MKNISIWNFYARAYDVINENVPYLQMLDEITKELPTEGSLRILDAGCGTGNLLKKMSEENLSSKFVGIDSSEEMLSRAKKKFPFDQRVSLHHANLDEKLEFTDHSFNRIVSSNTLYALKNPEKMISEFWRVLKPRGKMILTNPHDTSSFSGIMKKQWQELGFFKFITKFILHLPSLLVIIIVNVFFLKKNDNYWSQEKTISILKKNGFKNISIKLTYADQALLVSADKI